MPLPNGGLVVKQEVDRSIMEHLLPAGIVPPNYCFEGGHCSLPVAVSIASSLVNWTAPRWHDDPLDLPTINS